MFIRNVILFASLVFVQQASSAALNPNTYHNLFLNGLQSGWVMKRSPNTQPKTSQTLPIPESVKRMTEGANFFQPKNRLETAEELMKISQLMSVMNYRDTMMRYNSLPNFLL